MSPAWRATTDGELANVCCNTGPSLIQASDGKFWIAGAATIDSADSEIRIRNSTDGVNWNSAVNVTNNTTSDSQPSIIQDSNGSLWIAWRTVESGPDGDVRVANSSDGYNWNASSWIFNDFSTDRFTSLLQDRNGTYWAAWEHNVGNTSARIWLANSTNGVDRSAPFEATPLGVGGGCPCDPFIQKTSNGKFITTFTGADGDNNIFFSSSSNGVNWVAPTNITANTSGDLHSTTAVDRNGTIWVAWATNRYGANFDIVVSYSTVNITSPNLNVTWNGTQNISWVSISGDPANDSFALAYSANGVAYTTFTTGITADDIYTSKNYSWDTRTAPDGNYSLRITRSNSNNTHTETNNTTFNITIDNPPASVTGLAAVAVNTTAINWSWTNPANADFNHTEAYVDGVFVGNLSNTTTSYTNSTFTASTAHTLSLRTVDLAGNVNTTNWTNLTTTTQAPPAPVAATSSGGGCCAPAPAPARAGEPVVIVLPPGAPVEKIEVVTDEPVAVKVSVKPMAGPPPGAPPPPGPVARFMEVSLAGPSGEAVKAKSVAMEFSVERTWMNNNGVPQERVALARLEGARPPTHPVDATETRESGAEMKWAPYPAKVVSESAAEVKFRADVPGLSVFAVTAAPEKPPEPSLTPRVTPLPTPAPVLAPPSPTPEDGVRSVPPLPTPWQPGFDVAAALGALAAAATARRRLRR